MWYTVPMFIIWELIGGYNLVLKDNISKRAYACVWFTLLIYIILFSLKDGGFI